MKQLIIAVICMLFVATVLPARAMAAERSPNIVVIFMDDMGYADIGPFGSSVPTPNLDRMAKEGTKFTHFYAAQPVCSASRAALLTGCYPNRIGILGALGPTAKHGINADEVTLAEICKQKGYATAIFGKWHLGHHPEFLPTRHGFDEYFGLPYSNDMWPLHPTNKKFPVLPLIEGEKVVNPDVGHAEQEQLTTWYTEHAVDFIKRHKDQPFFLYVPHAMMHVPIYVSEKFRGKSGQGLYGDVIMEIDWSVGQILGALEAAGVDDNTLVIFTSDNGPWLSYGEHGGSAGELREGKGTTFEGGVREPTLMRFPGRIPAGAVCDEPLMTIDILPTVAHLIGAKLPDHKIDGLNAWEVISGTPGSKSPHEALFFYYHGNDLEGVRSGDWKLYFPHNYRTLAGREGGKGGTPTPYENGKTGLELYNLKNDPSERTNVADKHPQVVKRLQKLADQMRQDLGDSLTKTKGTGQREPGRIGG